MTMFPGDYTRKAGSCLRVSLFFPAIIGEILRKSEDHADRYGNCYCLQWKILQEKTLGNSGP
jgi:hypothetical protein